MAFRIIPSVGADIPAPYLFFPSAERAAIELARTRKTTVDVFDLDHGDVVCTVTFKGGPFQSVLLEARKPGF